MPRRFSGEFKAWLQSRVLCRVVVLTWLSSALVRRGFHKGSAKLFYADLELDRHRRRAIRGKEAIPLTSKEFALLELFLLRAPQPITRSEIIEHVWDCHFDSETNLVEVYINRLRQKIDHNRAVKLIHTVRGLGYRMVMPE